jgi:hypothetical protein
LPFPVLLCVKMLSMKARPGNVGLFIFAESFYYSV